MLNLLRPLVLVVVATLALATSCAHVPSEKERAGARGHYEAAVSLVTDAQKAGELGDQPGRDAKFREALKELLDGEKLVADDADTQYLLGQVYFLGFRRHDDALRHLEAAVAARRANAPSDASDAEREHPEAEQALGVVLVDAGRVEQSLAHFERARTNLLYQTPYFAEQELGHALFLLGRHDDARAHLVAAIQAQPDLCGAYTRLAEVHQAQGNDAALQKTLQDFLARCDSEKLRAAVGARMLAPAYFLLGQSRLRTGAIPAAAEAFRACGERFAQEPVAAECATQLQALGAAGAPPTEISSGG